MSAEKLSKIALFSMLGVGAAGAGYYFFDPADGRKRRSKLMKTTRKFVANAKHETVKSLKDAEHHLLGGMACCVSRLRSEEATDEVIVERVRSRMGRVVAHPHPIKVVSDQGIVTLWGPVAKHELLPLLYKVKATSGVKEIRNHLTTYRPQEKEIQAQSKKPGEIKWSPYKRLLIGVAGATAAVYGLYKKNFFGRALAFAGVGAMAGSTMKRNISSSLAFGECSQGFELEQTINVNAPVSDVFEFWVNPENYPQAFSHISSVEQIGENLYRWTVKGPAGIPIGWEGVITRIVPNTLVEWKSQPGSLIANFGTAHFDPNYDASTRLHVHMFYRPPAGILGRFAAEMFGSDPRSILRDDLRRLKWLFESGAITLRQERSAEEEAELLKMATT
jgi:uncharacterized membrane protein